MINGPPSLNPALLPPPPLLLLRQGMAKFLI
jgi:hypothetical protein